MSWRTAEAVAVKCPSSERPEPQPSRPSYFDELALDNTRHDPLHETQSVRRREAEDRLVELLDLITS
ncbi:MAG: hypothetical protein KF718_02375 [Polyangiaceae bacterium]|nr:hypothetical protein [Polyangiaceae bacterium]